MINVLSSSTLFYSIYIFVHYLRNLDSKAHTMIMLIKWLNNPIITIHGEKKKKRKKAIARNARIRKCIGYFAKLTNQRKSANIVTI